MLKVYVHRHKDHKQKKGYEPGLIKFIMIIIMMVPSYVFMLSCINTGSKMDVRLSDDVYFINLLIRLSKKLWAYIPMMIFFYQCVG